MQKVFEKIYSHHHWYDEESKSGPGATLRQTETVRLVLTALMRTLNIETILDIPCGDFNWMKEVDLTKSDYLGADIVPEIINRNMTNYSRTGRRFTWLDITTSKLPSVDLIFCRDCLVHFSYQDITKAIHNVRKSESKYLLTTTFLYKSNVDVETGGWRPLNLEAHPFSFPQPLELFNENCTEANGLYNDKSLALWRVNSLLC